MNPERISTNAQSKASPRRRHHAWRTAARHAGPALALLLAACSVEGIETLVPVDGGTGGGAGSNSTGGQAGGAGSGQAGSGGVRCERDGYSYRPGATFMEDCNACVCSDDGQAYCDDAECPDGNGVCPQIGCAQACPNGYVSGSNGCPTCECLERPAPCPQVDCDASCPGGYQLDEQGCQTCLCVDSSACRALDNKQACTSASNCRWLEPGCGGPPVLPIDAIGCYDLSDLDCEMSGCGDGRFCEIVDVLPACASSAGGPTGGPSSGEPAPATNCDACGQTIGVCL